MGSVVPTALSVVMYLHKCGNSVSNVMNSVALRDRQEGNRPLLPSPGPETLTVTLVVDSPWRGSLLATMPLYAKKSYG